ncbi:ATP-binding protein [Streptomyces zhihengii]
MKIAALATPAPPETYVFLGPNLPSTPRVARDWLVTLLRDTGHPRLVDAARVCASEVVTNVHLHTSTPQIIVEARVAEQWVLVVIYDNRPHALPELDEWHPEREHGRGLLLIDGYAHAWGVTRMPAPEPTCEAPKQAKKAVWFRLAETEGAAA